MKNILTQYIADQEWNCELKEVLVEFQNQNFDLNYIGLDSPHRIMDFFEANKSEINEFIGERGYSTATIFRDEWKDWDPLAMHEHNQILLVGYVIREVSKEMLLGSEVSV